MLGISSEDLFKFLIIPVLILLVKGIGYLVRRFFTKKDTYVDQVCRFLEVVSRELEKEGAGNREAKIRINQLEEKCRRGMLTAYDMRQILREVKEILNAHKVKDEVLFNKLDELDRLMAEQAKDLQ